MPAATAPRRRSDRQVSEQDRLVADRYRLQERIGGAMSGLSRMERAAFMLRHFEGRSIEEISHSLGLKTNATKHSIFRAVRKMRVALEPLMSTPRQPAGAEQ